MKWSPEDQEFEVSLGYTKYTYIQAFSNKLRNTAEITSFVLGEVWIDVTRQQICR